MRPGNKHRLLALEDGLAVADIALKAVIEWCHESGKLGWLGWLKVNAVWSVHHSTTTSLVSNGGDWTASA